MSDAAETVERAIVFEDARGERREEALQCVLQWLQELDECLLQVDLAERGDGVLFVILRMREDTYDHHAQMNIVTGAEHAGGRVLSLSELEYRERGDFFSRFNECTHQRLGLLSHQVPGAISSLPGPAELADATQARGLYSRDSTRGATGPVASPPTDSRRRGSDSPSATGPGSGVGGTALPGVSDSRARGSGLAAASETAAALPSTDSRARGSGLAAHGASETAGSLPSTASRARGSDASAAHAVTESAASLSDSRARGAAPVAHAATGSAASLIGASPARGAARATDFAASAPISESRARGGDGSVASPISEARAPGGDLADGATGFAASPQISDSRARGGDASVAHAATGAAVSPAHAPTTPFEASPARGAAQATDFAASAPISEARARGGDGSLASPINDSHARGGDAPAAHALSANGASTSDSRSRGAAGPAASPGSGAGGSAPSAQSGTSPSTPISDSRARARAGSAASPPTSVSRKRGSDSSPAASPPVIHSSAPESEAGPAASPPVLSDARGHGATASPGAVEQRRAPRHAVQASASVTTGAGTVSGAVSNLSAVGALLQLRPTPRLEEKVELEVKLPTGDVRAPATVVEVSARGVALEFSAPPPGLDEQLSGLPKPAERVGPYELLTLLGAGGTGEVHSARVVDGPTRGQQVALKRLPRRRAQDPEARRRLEAEAKTLARFKHPFIVRTLEAGVFDGQQCLVMELIEGHDLGQILRRSRARKRPLPVDVACYAVKVLLDALSAVHEAKDDAGAPLELVHGDVSPHNLFVSKTGVIKLGDFGLARPAGTEPEALKRGRPTFLSPEALDGEVSQAMDLWAAAVTLYELITLEQPFVGNTLDELTAAIRRGREVPLRERRDEVSGPLEAVLRSALEKDPARRFQTAREFAAAIAPHLHPVRTPRQLPELLRGLF